MKKFYLQVQTDGTITDAITYTHEDYIEYRAESLPVGVNGGWWKLENGKLVEYPELKPVTKDEEIEQLKQEQAVMQAALDELILGGL